MKRLIIIYTIAAFIFGGVIFAQSQNNLSTLVVMHKHLLIKKQREIIRYKIHELRKKKHHHKHHKI